MTVLSEHIYNLFDAGGENRAIALGMQGISFGANLIPGNDLPEEVLLRMGIYADDTTLYSSLGKSVFLGELVLHSIVE